MSQWLSPVALPTVIRMSTLSSVTSSVSMGSLTILRGSDRWIWAQVYERHSYILSLYPHPDEDYWERKMNSIISNKIFQSINMDLGKELIVQTNSNVSHMNCGRIFPLMKVSVLKVYESVSSNTSVAVLRTIKLKLWIEKELSHLDPETWSSSFSD